MAAPKKSLRPKPRPKGLGEKKSSAPETSITPRRRISDPERQYSLATVESRAEFDPSMSWNPIARLGFKGYERDKVTNLTVPEGFSEKIVGLDIKDNAFYIPSNISQKRATSLLKAEGVPSEVASTTTPDSIVTDVDTANPRTWSHEMSHRGFDRILEEINNDPGGPLAGQRKFQEKYGKRAFNALIGASGESYEGTTEMFDDVANSILRGEDPASDLDKVDLNRIKEFQKLIKKKPEDRSKFLVKKYEPYIKLMEAAQDILTESGEPPQAPSYKESFLDKIKIKLGFNEGGMVSEDTFGLSNQMGDLNFSAPSSSPIETEKKDSTLATPPLKKTSSFSRRPGFRGDGAFDFSGFGSFLKENVSEEELMAGLDKAGETLVPFYEAGGNVVNVIDEYSKPEEERNYEYIREELNKAGKSAATEAAMIALGGLAIKYGSKGLKALKNKASQYEIDTNTTSAFGVGSIRKKDTFEEVMTPVKSTKKNVKKTGEAILRPSEDLAADLDPRLGRAMSAETAGSIMPGPGKFFDPSKKGYKGDRFVGMLQDADIELDLEFGNYIMMGKGAPKDVSNETFENLFISARPSQKKTTFGQNNKSVARANVYDGPSLTVADMKANYKAATGKAGVEVRTNLLQPERFNVVTDKGLQDLDHPIVAVHNIQGDKKHYYTLDTQFVGPVRMDRITNKVNRKNKNTGEVKKEVPQPNLRPVTVGDVTLGDQVGTIKVGKKEHPLYDYIEVDATASAPEGMGSTQKFNEGGMAMKDQMDVVFKSSRAGYALGGEVDQIDPVSGNEVPPGSTPKEVRDDIPAMLSEGEYVVPADVTRYYGVKFFEDLRAQAKTDLAQMEVNGRIGGEEIPDDDDLTDDEMALLQEVMSAEEPTGMAMGGMVGQQMAPTDPYQQQAMMYKEPLKAAEGVSVGTTYKGQQLDPFGNPISAAPTPPTAPQTPQVSTPTAADPNKIYGLDTTTEQAPTTAIPVSTTTTATPDATPTGESGMKTTFYIHKDGRRISVLILNGRPISTVPADFGEFLEDTPENRTKLNFGVEEAAPEVTTEGVATSDDKDQTDDIDIRTKVDPNTPEGVQALYEDSGVNLKDPLQGAKDALEGATKIPQGAGIVASAINPFLGLGLGMANAAGQLTAVSKAQANLQMAEFLGKDEDATAIQTEIDNFIKNAPGVVGTLDEYVAKGTRRFNNAIEAATSIDAPEDAIIDFKKLSDKGKENVNEYIIAESPGYKGATVRDDGAIVREGPIRGEDLGGTFVETTTTDKGETVNVFKPGATTVRPKARPTAKPAAKPAATPTTSNDKSTRLDKTNPNTSANVTNHLSDREKESLAANPALTDHYVATANRRANESAAGDSSNTDNANEASDSGGCFLTTAIVERRGEADNGPTLTTLRNFRDTYLASIPEEVEKYYRVAPQIVASIPSDHKDWDWIGSQVDKSVEYIKKDMLDSAYTTYKAMVNRLEKDWIK